MILKITRRVFGKGVGALSASILLGGMKMGIIFLEDNSALGMSGPKNAQALKIDLVVALLWVYLKKREICTQFELQDCELFWWSFLLTWSRVVVSPPESLLLKAICVALFLTRRNAKSAAKYFVSCWGHRPHLRPWTCEGPWRDQEGIQNLFFHMTQNPEEIR